MDFELRLDMPLDMRQLYFGADLLAAGENPYPDENLKKRWLESLGEKSEGLALPGAPENYLLYPPHVLYALSVITPYISWVDFGGFIYVLNTLFILCAAWLLVKGRNRREVGLLLLLLLGFRSLFTAWILGNPVLTSFCLLLWMMVNREEKGSFLNGLLLFIAAIKPTAALPFVFFILADRQYKTFLYFLLAGASVYLLMLANQGWDFHFTLWKGWFHNMSEQTEVVYGPGHSFLKSNFSSLGVFLSDLFQTNLSGLFQILYGVSLLGISLLIAFKKLDKVRGLILLLLFALLFGYHLFYDLILLLIVIPLIADLKAFKWEGLLFLLLYIPWGYISGGFPAPVFILISLAILVIIHQPKTIQKQV